MVLQKLSKYTVLLIGVLLAVSCDQFKKYDHYKTLEKGSWHQDSIISFEVTLEDTLVPHHVFLNLRTDNRFPYRNMFVISTITSPEGFSFKDTLEYEMADAFGNWLGEGLTDVRNNKLFLLENYQFSTKGKYVFKVEQAMRKRGNVEGVNELLGILDVGLRIEEAQKK